MDGVSGGALEQVADMPAAVARGQGETMQRPGRRGVRRRRRQLAEHAFRTDQAIRHIVQNDAPLGRRQGACVDQKMVVH